MNQLKRNLGRCVRQRRMELGLTQTELAEAMQMDVQQADISRIERGYVPWPRPDLLTSLAKALSMGPLELITLSGWMTEEEYRHYRSVLGQKPATEIEKPLAILGLSDESDGLTTDLGSVLVEQFRTLTAFDGGTVLDTVTSQCPELVIVSQNCAELSFERLQATLQEKRLLTNVIVVGQRRSAVPRDLRFHYLKAPATPEALGSLLGAMGYRSGPAA